MHCPGLIAANWHTNTGVDVQLSNGVSCVSYVSSYVHRCAIGFPSWISSVLVAEKCLYVKWWYPPSSQTVRIAMCVLPVRYLTEVVDTCSEYWDHCKTVHYPCEKKETLLPALSRVNCDSGLILKVCLLPARCDPSQSNFYREIFPPICTQKILGPTSTAHRVPASLVACCAGWFPNLPQKQQGIKLLLRKDSWFSAILLLLNLCQFLLFHPSMASRHYG